MSKGSFRASFRRWTKRALVSSVSALVALGTAELALRALFTLRIGPSAYLHMHGAERDFAEAETLAELLALARTRFTPFERVRDFRLNSRALRTKEYTREKPAGVSRIVVLGDSFTWGSGGVPYESLWHRRFEAALRAEGHDAEVLALGWTGAGPRFELRMWQVEGAHLAPDLVVLAFFVGNDFIEVSDTLREWSVLDSLSARLFVARLVRNVRLADRSLIRVVHAGEVADASPPGGRVVPSSAPAYDPRRPQFPPEVFDRIEWHRMAICGTRREPEYRAALLRVERIVAQLAAEVESVGAELVLMVIPDEYQVDAELRARLLAAVGADPADFDLERPQRDLRALCEREGIACLDLLPTFRAHAADGPLYRLRDTHWNEEGNALAGRCLYAFLAERAPLAMRNGDR